MSSPQKGYKFDFHIAKQTNIPSLVEVHAVKSLNETTSWVEKKFNGKKLLNCLKKVENSSKAEQKKKMSITGYLGWEMGMFMVIEGRLY